MTEPTLKPLGRCQCRATHGGKAKHTRFIYGACIHVSKPCPSDAVRMVTVRGALVVNGTLEVPNQERTLAFCEPCAAFHESKGTR